MESDDASSPACWSSADVWSLLFTLAFALPAGSPASQSPSYASPLEPPLNGVVVGGGAASTVGMPSSSSGLGGDDVASRPVGGVAWRSCTY